ncbi:YmfQ family protein [Neptunomonas antarctica]|uniref:YmfQ family protein n=1 Tax=Neptunomonas antarctica TaxID=619304 RepID=UPI00138ED204|nr:putative phage tail protein [Neptunomonas antarctica]
MSDYRDTLLALLPRGDAWSTDADSALGQLMSGVGEEFARIEQRANDLLTEAAPSQTFELLDEWQQMYGLPDTCSGEQVFQQRRIALVQKYQLMGGQSREFLLGIAAVLGYEIAITEYQHRGFGADFGTNYAGHDWNNVVQINALLINYQERSHGQPHGETYRTWGNAGLECVFNRLIHAHRHIIYNYQETLD